MHFSSTLTNLLLAGASLLASTPSAYAARTHVRGLRKLDVAEDAAASRLPAGAASGRNDDPRRLWGYPDVTIWNDTPHKATIDVKYASCSISKFTVEPGHSHTDPGRGVCLVTEISGKLDGIDTPIKAYESDWPGTSYSRFEIQQDCRGDQQGWVDTWGDGCDWYQNNDGPGCPEYGTETDLEGTAASKACCHCNQNFAVDRIVN